MSGVKSGTNKIWAKLGANKNGAAALRPLIYLKISDGYFRAPRDGLSSCFASSLFSDLIIFGSRTIIFVTALHIVPFDLACVHCKQSCKFGELS